MKISIFLLTFTVSLSCFADINISKERFYICEELSQPDRIKVEQALITIREKKEECIANNLNCSSYVINNQRNSRGEIIRSNENVIDLWEYEHALQIKLDCDTLKKESNGQEAGVMEF